MKLPVGQLLCYIHVGALSVSPIITALVPSNVSHVSDNVKNGSVHLARSKGHNLQTYVSDFLIFSCWKVHTDIGNPHDNKQNDFHVRKFLRDPSLRKKET